MNPIINLQCKKNEICNDLVNRLNVKFDKSHKKKDKYIDKHFEHFEHFTQRKPCLPPTCMPTKICNPFGFQGSCTTGFQNTGDFGSNRWQTNMDNTAFNNVINKPIIHVNDQGNPTSKPIPFLGSGLYLKDFDIYENSAISYNLNEMSDAPLVNDFKFVNHRNLMKKFDKNGYLYGTDKIEYNEKYKGCKDWCNKEVLCGGFVVTTDYKGGAKCKYYSYYPSELRDNIIEKEGSTVYIKRCNRYNYGDYDPDSEQRPEIPSTTVKLSGRCIPYGYKKLDDKKKGNKEGFENNAIHEDGHSLNEFMKNQIGKDDDENTGCTFKTCKPRCLKGVNHDSYQNQIIFWLIIVAILILIGVVFRRK